MSVTPYYLPLEKTTCPAARVIFFAAFGLPCHHIISFYFRENIEIPVGSFSQHLRNECLEDEAVIQANVSSPTAKQGKKKLRMPKTENDQYNLATNLFRKLSETLSALTINDFQEKMRLFHETHALIKADKPIQLMQSTPQEGKNEEVTDDHDESPTDSTNEIPAANEKVSSWASLLLPVAPRKRGRPKENQGYFNTYHRHEKRQNTERNDRDDSLDKEAAILNEEAQAIAKEEEIRETIAVEELFCNCRRTGYKLNSFEWEFIRCDSKDCGSWYHRMCVKSCPENLEDEWFCENC
ncbi:Uncharacterized protein APZ42_031471 [Daphnia magna]|uniref:PHD-type domain-containing protein n=1 Tax=Daphnia magna TaxID=35525 RepID=A0A164MU25_9CRUS|nr:Uncharacterized protein APZ42_031471 [Daphnia magna]